MGESIRCWGLCCESNDDARVEALGAADEGTAEFVETEDTIGVFCDADADAFADWAGLADCRAQPERAFAADQVQSIELAVYAKCGSYPPGPSRQIEYLVCVAGALHEVYAFERLDGANQYPRANSLLATRNIQHEMISVTKINVGVAALEEKRFVARGEAAEGMGGSVANEIGFRFDDSSTEAALWDFVHERFADEEFCEFDRIQRQVAQAKAANATPDLALVRAGRGGAKRLSLGHDSGIYSIEDAGERDFFWRDSRLFYLKLRRE